MATELAKKWEAVAELRRRGHRHELVSNLDLSKASTHPGCNGWHVNQPGDRELQLPGLNTSHRGAGAASDGDSS